MTTEELQAIRKRNSLAQKNPERIHQLNRSADVPALLAEVDRLTAELAAERERYANLNKTYDEELDMRKGVSHA